MDNESSVDGQSNNVQSFRGGNFNINPTMLTTKQLEMLIDIHQKRRKEEDERNSINDVDNDPPVVDKADADNLDFNNVPEGDLKGDIEAHKMTILLPVQLYCMLIHTTNRNTVKQKNRIARELVF